MKIINAYLQGRVSLMDVYSELLDGSDHPDLSQLPVEDLIYLKELFQEIAQSPSDSTMWTMGCGSHEMTPEEADTTRKQAQALVVSISSIDQRKAA